MVSSPRRWPVVVAALLASLAAEPPSTTSRDEKSIPPQPAASAKKAPPSGLESLKLPDDAIIILMEKLPDALRMAPKQVILSLEKYQEIIDERDRLRNRANSIRPAAPSLCELRGKVEGASPCRRGHPG